MLKIFYPTTYEEIIHTYCKYKKAHGNSTIVGSGYSFLIKNSTTHNTSEKCLISLSKINKIINFDPAKDEITVQAGTKLYEINDYLEKHARTLKSTPEFMGVSAGACVATPIHGSSRDYVCLADTVTKIKYLKNGIVREITPQDHFWSDIFFNSDKNLIYLEITFKVTKEIDIYFLTTWLNRSSILQYLRDWCPQKSEYYIITWYFKQQVAFTMDMYKEDTTNSDKFILSKPYKYPRFIPYMIARTLHFFRKHKIFFGKQAYIMTGWRKLSLFEICVIKFTTKLTSKVDLEFCIQANHGVKIFEMLNNMLKDRNMFLGIRIGRDATRNEKIFWFELPNCPTKFLPGLYESLKPFNPKFHNGKVSPN